jgi:uncharacterized protein
VNLAPVPHLGFGEVRHTRLRPRRNAFVYPTCFLMLPMRTLQRESGVLPLNRWAGISFHDRDHGDGRGPEAGGALAWLDEVLRANGVDDADGEVWLHCYPRVLGHTFKPVSFWYCHRADGTLRAVLAEVNNTFGERHCYLLDRPGLGAEVQATKVFHVSPFCSVEGRYRFRFMHAARQGKPCTVVRIDHDDEEGVLLQTSVSGVLEPVTARSMQRALWGYPAMTLMVVARIHWQALKLWAKRVGFRRKPEPPESFVTQ